MEKNTAFIILIYTLSIIKSFAQLNETEHYTANFHSQPNPKINVSMYYAKVAYELGQAYWITIQNLTGRHISVTGEYFANLKCSNQSRAKIEIDIKAYETAVPASGYLADATGLQARAERELCDIPSKYENGRTVWYSIIENVGFQIFNIKDLDAEDNQNTNNSQQNQTSGQNKNLNSNDNYSSQSNYQNNNQQLQNQEALRREQLQRVNEANRQTGEAWQNVYSTIGDIADVIMQNLFRNSINDENRQRQQAFNDLQEEVKTGNGQLENCGACSGLGYTSCDYCGGAGKKTCMSCYGKGSTMCTLCSGTGVFVGQTCTACGGKGSSECMVCKSTGNMYCTYCHASGKYFCMSCRGTGQKFQDGR